MMPKYADFMYNLGLLDESESAYFKDQTMKAAEFIKQKQYFEAFKVGFVAVFCSFFGVGGGGGAVSFWLFVSVM